MVFCKENRCSIMMEDQPIPSEAQQDQERATPAIKSEILSMGRNYGNIIKSHQALPASS
jgi:hypothetical protein